MDEEDKVPAVSLVAVFVVAGLLGVIVVVVGVTSFDVPADSLEVVFSIGRSMSFEKPIT